MKFCAAHWAELRGAVEAAGLGDLIAKSTAELEARLRAHHSGNAKAVDPLLMAHNMILNNAVRRVGISLMGNNADGTERCPLCFVIDGCICTKGDQCEYRQWIAFATRDVRREVLRLGLVGTA